MFPKRNEDKSGVNPGARKLKMIPMAMPNVQNTAIAESSRMSLRLLSHSTPKADRIEGEPCSKQRRNTAVKSDSDASEGCMGNSSADKNESAGYDTGSDATAMLAKRLPNRACWKKVY